MRAVSRRALLAVLLCAAAALPGIAPSAAAADPQLVFSTYLGGAFKYGDIGNDVAVDAAGNVYVTGRSYYSSFPVTPGAFQTHFKPIGPWDTTAFVAKFDPTGSRLIYATYLSGKGGETTGEGIAVDAAGDAYVSGYTSSDGFPTTPGTLRESGTGGFVAKLDPSGGGLLYATLIGDSSTHAGRIAVDPSGSAYVAGAGTVVKLNPTGSALDYTHRLGPGGVAGVAADSEGHAYIAQSQGHERLADRARRRWVGRRRFDPTRRPAARGPLPMRDLRRRGRLRRPRLRHRRRRLAEVPDDDRGAAAAARRPAPRERPLRQRARAGGGRTRSTRPT